jgi:hypothetical protein
MLVEYRLKWKADRDPRPRVVSRDRRPEVDGYLDAAPHSKAVGIKP